LVVGARKKGEIERKGFVKNCCNRITQMTHHSFLLRPTDIGIIIIHIYILP